jgi:hypothetical protein
MQTQKSVIEQIEYRIALIEPASRNIMAIDVVGVYHLPTVSVPSLARPAQQILHTLKTKWGIHALVLDFFPSGDVSSYCVVAELLCRDSGERLTPIPLDRIDRLELSEEQRGLIQAMLTQKGRNPFSQVGWIDEAIAWLEMETGKKVLSRVEIEQYNAGGAFSLVRFRTQDGCDYWLKATGEPNVHELAITKTLSELGGEYLPDLIATKPAWNAWLTLGESIQSPEALIEPRQFFLFLKDAVTSMAELQLTVCDRTQELVQAGTFDQSASAFQCGSEALFDYVEEAMSLQTATHVPRLDKVRLQQLRNMFYSVCRRVEDLDLPNTLVHGDLTLGSILIGEEHCKFTDWSEACIGNPFISLQHLLLLNNREDESLAQSMNHVLTNAYSEVWKPHCSSVAIDAGVRYMPIFGIISALYGRGDWFDSPLRHDLRRQSYVRSLTRHLDRAAHSSEWLEALCR